jgi:hypothetical protein
MSQNETKRDNPGTNNHPLVNPGPPSNPGRPPHVPPIERPRPVRPQKPHAATI